MTRKKSIWKSLRVWNRRNRYVLFQFLLHTIVVLVFLAIFIGLKRWLPSDVAAADLENSIQLLAQVLALVVGVLLLGTTVSLSSYDGSETISKIHSGLENLPEPFFKKFFSGPPQRHKLDTPAFRRFLLRRPQVETLLFKEYSSDETDEGWFIYRPYWDGVWYQIESSPFNHLDLALEKLVQVQYLHEATICANMVLNAVYRLRKSGGALIKNGHGTNGANWFLDAFEKCNTKESLTLPSELSLHEAISTVALAIRSEHYMQEELREHANNVEWKPVVLTAFQLKYIDYSVALSQLIQKLQFLRWANLNHRYPSTDPEKEKHIFDVLGLDELGELRKDLAALRAQVVTAHGAARYFHHIKSWSVPGIGISLLVLMGVLCGWPYLKWAASPNIRTDGFILLYSAAIAALAESAFFLVRLLWQRRVAI